MRGHGKRTKQAHLVEETPTLSSGHRFGRVLELRGKSIVVVAVAEAVPDGLVEVDSSASPTVDGRRRWTVSASLAALPPRFRGVLFLRRGAAVLLSPLAAAESDAKVAWTIDEVLRPEDVRAYTRDGVWPTPWLPEHRLPSDEPETSAQRSDDSESGHSTSDDSDAL